MSYENTYTSDDIFSGYEPYGDVAATPQVPTSRTTRVSQVAEPDYDPRKTVNFAAKKLFGDVVSDRHLGHEAKMRIQSRLLDGFNDVAAQRARLEGERARTIADNLRIKKAEGTLEEMRLRRQAAEDQSASQNTFTNAVQAVMQNQELNPAAKRVEIDKITTENLGLVAANPRLKDVANTAKSTLPKPQKPTFTDQQKVEYRKLGISEEIIGTEDPILIGAAAEKIELKKAEASNNVREQRAAEKRRVTVLKDLAKEDFKLIPELDRYKYGISVNDETPYLIPEDHIRGKELASRILTTEEYEIFDALPDAEKHRELRKLQIKGLTAAAEIATQEKKPITDTLADELVFGL